jgi:hypothetical protein
VDVREDATRARLDAKIHHPCARSEYLSDVANTLWFVLIDFPPNYQDIESSHLDLRASNLSYFTNYFQTLRLYLSITSSTILTSQPTNIMADQVEPPALVSEDSYSATEVFNSVKVSLADLCAKGTAHYAHKNFEEATDLYARASELQAELNGEMSPENAEILFLYGRSLFKVGQSKSDVLGGRAAGEKKKPNGTTKAKKADARKEPTGELEKVTEEAVAIIAEQNGGTVKADEDADTKKPLFQFTGDENFEDSDDEEVR